MRAASSVDRAAVDESDRLALSALADGQASRSEVDRLLGRWARDPALQRDWQDWHRIGDVMRSDELARPAAHDEAFVRRLRARLEQERSVQGERLVLVGAPPSAAGPRAGVPGGSSGWRMPLALAAGVAAVAFGISWLQWPQDPAAEPVVSRLQLPAAPRVGTPLAVPEAHGPVTASPRTVSAASVAGRGPAIGPLAPGGPPSGMNGPLLRDPGLDEVLRAHRAPGAPKGPLVGPTPEAASGRVETVGWDR